MRANKENLIVLLQEKRAVLISHTVTKGLDADAPIKDSKSLWKANTRETWNQQTARQEVAAGRTRALWFAGG